MTPIRNTPKSRKPYVDQVLKECFKKIARGDSDERIAADNAIRIHIRMRNKEARKKS